MSNDIEKNLRDTVKGLFADKKVDIVIGFEQGSLPFLARPCFIKSAEKTEKLIWNSSCSNNIAVFLPRFFSRKPPVKDKANEIPVVGIVTKGCDARSVIGLVKEKQVLRDKVVIIGIPCEGVIDPHKLETALEGESITGWKYTSNGFIECTTNRNHSTRLKKEDLLAESCLQCAHPEPENMDIRIEGKSKSSVHDKYKNIKDFEEKTLNERWQYFTDEISKCIKCNACRQACPNCYCKVCFADQTKPRWIGPGFDLSDIMIYHIGRIFHQAGRCVECDACVRACPMNIDLRLFTRKVCKDVKELFSYVPGLSVDELPPLLCFNQDDSEDFITAIK